MPQIPQIGDSTGKSYSTTLGNNRGGSGSEQQFTVDGSGKPEQVQVISDKNAGNNAQTTMGQKDLIPLAVTVSKSQALAVETIKDIINADLLNTARLNGYTELAGELENLSRSLYIPADKLLDEILEQENQNTMFINDEFYDILREAAEDANPDLKEAIGNMLKAINFSQNKNEITSALSSNLKFLAEYFSPNRVLSEKLSELAERWGSGEAGVDFTGIRGETSELLKNVSESLLNDSHTQTLLPIVIHNISKYNTNDTMLREYFGQLLTQIPSYEMRNGLLNAFEGLLAKLAGQAENSGETAPEQASDNGQTVPLTNYTTNEEKNQVENSFFSKEITIFSKENAKFENFSDYMDKLLTDEEYLSDAGLDSPDFSRYITALHRGNQDGRQVIAALLSELVPDEEVQTAIADQLDRTGSMQELVNFLNGFLGSMPDTPLRDSIFEALDEAISVLAEQNVFDEVRQEDHDVQAGAAPEQREVPGDAEEQPFAAERTDIPGDGEQQVNVLRDEQEQSAVQQAAQAQDAEAPENAENRQEPLQNAADQQNTAQNAQLRQDGAQNAGKADEAVRQQGEPGEGASEAASEGYGAQGASEPRHSSIQALTDFVSRNINHPALKSIDSFNASNLLQSMINAPGVMTPLSHFILPVQVEDTRAFGELWVDNDDGSEKSETGERKKNYHMFLTFDVDAFGRFEVDVYAGGNTVNVSLLHPPGFGKNIDQMINKINRIAAGSGYTIGKFETGVLKKPHDLTQIFPKLIERRAGLNVQA